MLYILWISPSGMGVIPPTVKRNEYSMSECLLTVLYIHQIFLRDKYIYYPESKVWHGDCPLTAVSV